MRVREYLEKYNTDSVIQITFIKARAREDAHTPFYHAEYQTTPKFYINELIKDNNKLLDYYILNDKQPPIDWLSGACWNYSFVRGHLICMLVIDDENLDLLFSKEQGASIIKYIEKTIHENSLKEQMRSLKAARLDKGMSQSELSVKSGISLRTIQKYENGDINIESAAVSKIIALADALGVEVKQIV